MASNSWGATRYVRTDGGTGSQCTGLTDHALAGATGTACGVNHPNWVFPPRGESSSVAAAVGDTIVIETGSYRIGCQNSTNCRDSSVNLTSSSFCATAFSYDCWPNIIPNNVTIMGCTASGCSCTTTFNGTTKLWVTSCSSTRPELWGAGNINQVLNITGSSGISIEDLEITDHASCGYPSPVSSANCGHGADATSLAAQDGILQTNSNNVLYKNLNVHGMVRYGMYGGSVGNHQIENTTVGYNGLGGINYDSCNNNGTCGVSLGNYMRFYKTHVIFNGCVENYSGGAGTIINLSCHDQNTTGYGDGVGGTSSSGNWDVQDADFSHNVSDGLDLLYFNQAGVTGGNLTVKRSLFEGNVGDQLKSDNNVTVEDSYIIDNCTYFKGKAFSDTSITMCRGGYAVTIANSTNSGTTTAKFYNNTITSNSDVLFGACSAGNSSNNFTIDARNNVLLGGADFNGGDATSIFFSDCSTHTATFSEDYNTCTNNFKEASPCPGSHSKNNQTIANTFAGTIKQGTVGSGDITTYYGLADYVQQLTLKNTSLAVGNALTTITGTDSKGYGTQDRGVTWDMGALNFTGGVSPTCGDGTVASPETCDDGNTTSGDGCSNVCSTESGWSCSGNPSVCTTTCGDGIKAGTEQCDDGNLNNGDGCSSTCTTEPGSTHPTVISGAVTISGQVTIN